MENPVVCTVIFVESELCADAVTAAVERDEFAALSVGSVVSDGEVDILETVVFLTAFGVLIDGDGDDAVVISFGSILLLQYSP